jgi:phosphopentomutase
VKRLFWFVLDSLGIGGAPDAGKYGDCGSDTLGHIAEWFMNHEGRPLNLPNLKSLGLGAAYQLVHRQQPVGWSEERVTGTFAAASEISTGKDTPSGHWEMAGVPVNWEWAYYPDTQECFPRELLGMIYSKSGLKGSLANHHASGTVVIEEFGGESMRTGMPIFYTSADSVFQIAAHEDHFGLERLYQLCELVRGLTLEPLVGRVIARPFIGESGAFMRTGNRRDFAVRPPKPTVLQIVKDAGFVVTGLGKIGDIFAHVGLTNEVKASGHDELWKKTREAAADGGLIMTNFVDFDMLYGHRRDPRGYGLALEEWDRELGRFLEEMSSDDAIVITADHGNDPTWSGTDHTRERVPILMIGGEFSGLGNSGIRESFADIGATIGKFFGVEMDEGTVIE